MEWEEKECGWLDLAGLDPPYTTTLRTALVEAAWVARQRRRPVQKLKALGVKVTFEETRQAA